MLQNESDSSDEELTASPAKRSKPEDDSSYIDKVMERAKKYVSPKDYLTTLGIHLGLDYPQIQQLQSDNPAQEHWCREMLCRWRNSGRKATLQDLEDTVKYIDEEYTAEEFGGASPCSKDRNEGQRRGSAANPPKQRPGKRKKKAEPRATCSGYMEAPADDGDGKIDVIVKRCDEEFWEKVTKEKNPYRMDSKPRGDALILNNTNFTHLRERKGGAVDLSNITALMEGLSFETYILEDKKAQVQE